uniref:Uncharacterized protein n=1 Tax=Catagonus wagneri TaxID=51154 RepID=A0A8C3VFA0_9CETA
MRLRVRSLALLSPLRIVVLVISVGLTWIVVSILFGGPGSGFPRIQQLFASEAPSGPRSASWRPAGLPYRPAALAGNTSPGSVEFSV